MDSPGPFASIKRAERRARKTMGTKNRSRYMICARRAGVQVQREDIRLPNPPQSSQVASRKPMVSSLP